MPLVISASPHVRTKLNTQGVMFQVIYALLPAVCASIYLFRLSALLVILNCIVTSVATEEIIQRIRKRPSSLGDGSSIVTGLLLALCLPPSTAWYGATVGSVFAILVGKHIFGGLGHNIFNPALIGRAFLMAAYPRMLTTWVNPIGVDAISSATPLALRKFDSVFTSVGDLFVGNVAGCIGETSAVLLILGGLYLVIRKIADWRLPLSMILTVIIFSFIFSVRDPDNGSVLFHLFSGGLMLGAFFMATDPVTTPFTKKGRWIFGIGAGSITMVIRYFSGLPEGVMYAILFMNGLVPLIDRYTRPRSFGSVKKSV